MDLTAAQIVILVGVPALVLAVALFLTRSVWRTVIGYVVLVVAFGVIAMVDGVAGAAFGLVIALLYAGGRGGRAESGTDPLEEVAGHTGSLTRTSDA